LGALILVIEDEREIRRYLTVALEGLGHSVIEAATAREGQQAMIARRPDIVILDLGLPDRDGQDVIRDFREWSHTPIIVLSARDRETDKVEALENGADDYLTKPFSALELAARIKVALRHRAGSEMAGEPVFRQDGLMVDLSARAVTLDGEAVHPTPIEYKLLTTLIRHAGKVLTHGQLTKEIWGRHSPDSNQGLRIHTQHLREKLKDDPLAPRFIITEPGIGYRFKV
jgi:two-component system, OmpR family, KDP operon response regulator KdpE